MSTPATASVPGDDGFTENGLFLRLEVALEQCLNRDMARLSNIENLEPEHRQMTLGEKFAFIAGYQAFAFTLINAVTRSNLSDGEIPFDQISIVKDAMQCGVPDPRVLAAVLDPAFPENMKPKKNEP